MLKDNSSSKQHNPLLSLPFWRRTLSSPPESASKVKRIRKGFGLKNFAAVCSQLLSEMFIYTPESSSIPTTRERERESQKLSACLNSDCGRNRPRSMESGLCVLRVCIIDWFLFRELRSDSSFSRSRSLSFLDIVSYYLLILPGVCCSFCSVGLSQLEFDCCLNLLGSAILRCTNKFTFWQISHGAWLDLKRWRRTAAGEVFSPFSVLVEPVYLSDLFTFLGSSSVDANGAAAFVYAHAEQDSYVLHQ